VAVTIRDVARLAKASPAAVSATLSGSIGKGIRVGEATRLRILAAAEETGYRPNRIAQSLATGRSRVVGLMLPYLDAFFDRNPFCQEAMNGILREVVRTQYNAMLYTSIEETADRLNPFDFNVDGMVLVMPPREGAITRQCDAMNLPFVSILRPFAEGGMTVNSDDYRGGQIATEHLISLGHRRIAHLSGNDETMTSIPREQGYRDAMTAAGLEPMVFPAGFDWTGGEAVIRELMGRAASKRPTAVFSCNDLCADGAMRAAKQLGFRVPDDLAVVGFDDTWFAMMTQPSLTSVSMSIPAMGEVAAKMLIDFLEGIPITAPQVTMPVSLTIRSSCGATTVPVSAETTPSSPNPQ